MTRCTTCEAPLAHDQRYCVECGTRRGPLPELVAAMIAGIEGRPRAGVPGPDGAGVAGGQAGRAAAGWMPSPRAAALAVLGMLAFGAEIGAVVGATGGAALASAPLIVLRHALSPSATTAADSGGGSSSGGGVTTVTVTTPASSSGGASSGGGGSTAAAASPASTSTPTTTSGTTTTASAPTNPYGLPAITHVFVIMLGDQGYSQTFGSQDPYLSKTLPKQGKLIQTYYAVAGGELANQIALISGQGPTQQTTADCPTFAKIAPAHVGKHDQVLGNGCVYPHTTSTLAGQLTADHLTSKAYIQGMANGEPGQAQTCRHPALGATDSNQAPQPGDPYVTWRDPFVYFHSVIDPTSCRHDVVDLSQLSTDLTTTSTTPNVSYIVPNLCDDGSDQPCAPGATSGVAGADSFLRTLLPEIKSSAAYQAGGLILVTFDQAPQTGQYADSSSCCATPRYPNLSNAPSTSTTPTTTTPAPTTTSTTAAPTTATTTIPLPLPTTTPTVTIPTPTPTTTTTSSTTSPPTTTPTSSTTTTPPVNLGAGQGQTSSTGGGGQVGLLLISPWVKPGTLDVSDYYNHFSLLESIEDIFDLKHLGYAGASGLPALDASIFDGKGPSGS